MGRREGGKVAGLTPPRQLAQVCALSGKRGGDEHATAGVGTRGRAGGRRLQVPSGGGGSRTEPAAVPRCLRTCGRAGRQPRGAEGTCVGGGCGCAGGGRHAGGLLLCGPGVHVSVLTTHHA